jgi:hypothetical protein
MTREQWQKMSYDEKNIKIAELCGYTDIAERYIDGLKLTGIFCVMRDYTPIPNYIDDLNAMQIALGTMSEEQRFRYGQNFVRDSDKMSLMEWNFYFHTAPSEERAEAFTLTMEEKQ